MKKLLMLVVGLFLFAASLVSAERTFPEISPAIQSLLGIDGKYDSHSVLMSAIELEKLGRFVKELPLLEARFKVKILPNQFGIPEEEKEMEHSAVGNFIGNRYILSIAHFAQNPIYNLNTPFGSLSMPIEVKERKFSIFVFEREFELRAIKIDFEQDWALFEIQEELKGEYQPPKIGKSGELIPGHFLYFIGHPFGGGTLLRSGIVEADSFELKKLGPAISKDDVFALSGGVYPGDSGGPVFALRDGKLELIGMMRSTHLYTNIGYALKINPILEKIKAAIGLDLTK